jgi:surfactin synthase thioesterase subunit
MKKNGLPSIALLVALGLLATSARALPGGLSFAGVPLAPGATVRAEVPLSAVEKSYVAEAGNTVPANAVAVLAVPANFNPNKTWPVLVVFSTSDFKILNRDDLVRLYRETALAEGWVVLAGDGPGQPKRDTSGWRAGMTLAALDALHRSFPGSKNWPVACAGYSGGAKRAGLLAPLLALAGCRMSGLFLTGINVDRATDGYRQFKPGASYLRTPVFISTGSSDNVATPQQQSAVRASMLRTGFNPVRQEMFPGGHVVKRSHLAEALRWFRKPS